MAALPRDRRARGTVKVVNIDGYTEICLGLTDWSTGYEVAATPAPPAISPRTMISRLREAARASTIP